jgi:hypothetical protein
LIKYYPPDAGAKRRHGRAIRPRPR